LDSRIRGDDGGFFRSRPPARADELHLTCYKHPKPFKTFRDMLLDSAPSISLAQSESISPNLRINRFAHPR
jgi:hypothetical protein